MKELIRDFPEQIDTSINIGDRQRLKAINSEIRNVVFCGMGGSGIGARIVSQWIENEIKVPIIHVQNYEIPEFINEYSLVIGSSYSGNTEETLAALLKCRTKGAQIMGVSSGGQLKTFCDEHNYDIIIVPGGLPPRAALAYSLVQLLVILNHFKLVSNTVKNQLGQTAPFLKNNLAEVMAKAKEIALKINNTQVVLYAEAPYESIAIRGKQQFNENGKYLCRHHVIPEMNHNELLGWGCGDSKHSAVFLHTSDMNNRNIKRFKLTSEIISKKTENITNIIAKGSNKIEESMYLIYVLDWVSYFLGTARNEDTIEIKNIDYLKSELAK